MTKRILFVYHELTQSGAVRYFYEICRQMDRSRYEPHVLVEQHTSAQQYFWPRLRELGVPIHTDLKRSRKTLGRSPRTPGRRASLRRALDALDPVDARLQARALRPFLASFDCVSIVLIETYRWLEDAIAAHPNVFLHLLSDRLQYDYNPYSQLRHAPRGVVLQHWQQHDDVAGSLLERVPSAIVELPFRFDTRRSLNLAEPSSAPHIAVFCRHHPERPMAGLLVAFKDLLREFPGARLSIYGGGDATASTRLVSILRIADRVTFLPHGDIQETLQPGKFSMVWSTSRSNSHGYAALEVLNCGVPMLFWNIDPLTSPEPLPTWICDTAHDLALSTARLLRDPVELRRLALEQIAQVQGMYGAEHVVPKLEQFYENS